VGFAQGEEEMATKLSKADLKKYVNRFQEIAAGFEIELGELKDNGRYIHILRNGRIIGCFISKRTDIVFEFQNSHPRRREQILVNGLTDKDIKSAIFESQRRYL
jgi:hypothetical protein